MEILNCCLTEMRRVSEERSGLYLLFPLLSDISAGVTGFLDRSIRVILEQMKVACVTDAQYLWIPNFM